MNNQTQQKPSDILNDKSGTAHKRAADAANRKRAERKAAQQRAEQEARWEAENKAAEEAKQRRQAQKDARREADRKLEEERLAREQEEAMWSAFNHQETKPKKERATKSGGKGTIKVECNGINYDSLAAFIYTLPGTSNVRGTKDYDYALSLWTKGNRHLKSKGVWNHNGLIINLI